MKLASFKLKSTGAPSIGVVLDGGILDLHAASGGKLPSAMIAFLELGADGMAQARKLAAAGGKLLKDDEIELQAPVPRPGKIMHTSCNFSAHLEELTTWQEPEWQSHNWGNFHFQHPTGFLEAPSSVVPTGARVPVPHFTQQLDYEVEIGVIIGRPAFRVSREEALDYVAGLTIFNDLSARDLQFNHQQFFKGKSIDGACPMGPWIVTADEIANPHGLAIQCRVNGTVKQDWTTGDMIFDIPTTIARLSEGLTLLPGDVIATGTPSGVGFARTPPEFLKPGNVVECEIEGIGTIRNKITRS